MALFLNESPVVLPPHSVYALSKAQVRCQMSPPWPLVASYHQSSSTKDPTLIPLTNPLTPQASGEGFTVENYSWMT